MAQQNKKTIRFAFNINIFNDLKLLCVFNVVSLPFDISVFEGIFNDDLSF